MQPLGCTRASKDGGASGKGVDHHPSRRALKKRALLSMTVTNCSADSIT
jgi:hypothetical protein